MKIFLNKRLIEKQGLKDSDVKKLHNLHAMMQALFTLMKSTDPKTQNSELRECVGLIELIEYKMQEVWKFDLNRDYHTWWVKAPHCTCPKMDNADPIYFGRRIIRGDCPLHGNEK